MLTGTKANVPSVPLQREFNGTRRDEAEERTEVPMLGVRGSETRGTDLLLCFAESREQAGRDRIGREAVRQGA
ncbi:hypothetical protein D7W79_27685 [Corallococcus exercitus]|nr:hypothetical protein D7W79_27685 [Corallococcus exercitus]